MHLSTNTHAFYIQPHDSHFHNLFIIALHLISPRFTVAAHRTFRAFWCLVGVEVKSIGSETSLNPIFITSWLCDQGMWLPIMFLWLNLFIYKVGIIPSVLRIKQCLPYVFKISTYNLLRSSIHRNCCATQDFSTYYFVKAMLYYIFLIFPDIYWSKTRLRDI